MTTLWTLAASANPPTDLVSYLAQFGVVGLLAAALIMVVRNLYGRLEKTTEERISDIQRLQEQQMANLQHGHDLAMQAKDEQITQLTEDKRILQRANDEAILFMRDKLVPALAESTRITAEYVEQLRRQRGNQM